MSTQKKNLKNVSAPQPTKSRVVETPQDYKPFTELVFGRKNYYIMIGGALLILLGLLLMTGGNMPSPDVWDESIIYSARRTIVAPFFILAGLAAQIVAIFTKKN